jgi:predicted HTH transcriptional regulator
MQVHMIVSSNVRHIIIPNIKKTNSKNDNMTVHMNKHSDKILPFVKERKVVTSSEVAKMLKCSWNTADKYLLELLVQRKVERIKKEGVTLWIVPA